MERENGFYWVCYKNDSVENNWVIKQWNGAMWYDKAQSKDSDLIIDERKIVRKKDATLIAAALPTEECVREWMKGGDEISWKHKTEWSNEEIFQEIYNALTYFIKKWQ